MKIVAIYAFFLAVINLVFGLYFYEKNSFVWEGIDFAFNLSADYFVLYFFALFLFVFSLYIISAVANRFALACKNNRISRNQLGERHWNILWSLMAAYIILGGALNQWYGLNIAGKPNPEDVSKFVKLATTVLNTDYICAFFLCFRFSSFKKYIFLSGLFVMGFFMRGWMGGILIVLICWLINFRIYPQTWPETTQKFALCTLLLAFIGMPFFIFTKYQVRNAGGLDETFVDNLIEFFSGNEFFKIYIDATCSVLERFQSIDAYALFVNNCPEIVAGYVSNRIVPFYEDNILSAALFPASGSIPLGQFIAGLYLSEDVLWATHPGFMGWMFVGGGGFLVFAVVALFIAFFIARLLPEPGVYILVAFYSLLYLWHGWVSAYINVIVYLLYFLFLNKLTSFAGGCRRF
jgi:hypothetical protein